MKLSKNWLQDYVDIQNSDLFHTLSLHTAEVEEEVHIGHMPHVVIGHVLSVKQHPNADKLRIATVDTGEESPRTIVCGATNLAEGQKVAAALPGAVMPAGFTITVSTLRGVESQGMLCSEDELGLVNERQPGIMELPEDAPVGTLLEEYLDTKDTTYDIENKSITNRPDLFGHYGIARECSVLFDLPLAPLSTSLPTIEHTLPSIPVSIQSKDSCKRYCAISIDNLTLKESPAWMQKRLRNIGQTPKNSVVDVTNYIMYDLGFPIHAFDADKIGDDIQIGYLDVPEEELVTLDGKPRSVHNETLLIKSNNKPIAIAGIMGLEESAVSEHTQNILLEAACFDGGIIRKGELALNLRTEASIRFEKYLNPELCRVALEKAVALILEIHPEAHISSGITDIYPTPLEPAVVHTSYSFLRERIGNNFSKEFIDTTLSKLGCTLSDDGDKLSITAPSWRSTGDISIPEDIVEELVRVYGYNSIEPTAPLFPLKPAPQAKLYTRKEELIELLTNCGLSEISTYSFYSKELHSTFGLDKEQYTPISIMNPLSIEQEIMRTSIAPQLAKHAAHYAVHGANYGAFTIERVYLEENDTTSEVNRIAIVASSETEESSSQDLYNSHPLYHIKSCIERIAAKKSFALSFKSARSSHPFLHPQRTVDIYVGDIYLGYIGELHPKVAHTIDAKQKIAVCEIDFNAFIAQWGSPVMQEYSSFPGVERDLSLVVDKKQEVGILMEYIQRFHPHITDVSFIDIFEGSSVPEGKKSTTLHLRLEHMERTMTDEEVLHIMTDLFDALRKDFGAEIRGV